MTNKVNSRNPLEKGFMRNGLFKFPTNTFKCVDCKKEFQNNSGIALRCIECKKKHRKEYMRKYGKTRLR